MDMRLNWLPAIPLAFEDRNYQMDFTKLPKERGVYMFGRRYGRTFEALYVGKATRLYYRVRGQFDNHRLMQHLEDASAGTRVLLAGVLHNRPGTDPDACLVLIERALIRHFVTEGPDLVNQQGTHLRFHAVTSEGRHPARWFPKTLYLER